ncbi:MAG: HEAT repeat domain-containing protein [Rhodothermales bacterium]|nr:HEAT repeat domain-containing protein [Rhodothermales bacterium]
MFNRKIFAGLIAATLFFAIQAEAQHVRVEAERPAVWTMFVGQQIAESLESPSADIRVKALENIIQIARSFGDELDLTEAVPQLLSIYNADDDERCRLAAVVGLHAIGDEHGYQHVRKGVAVQASKRVQHAALAVLWDHYGAATFEGAEDMAGIAESVLEYYDSVELTPPAIAALH